MLMRSRTRSKISANGTKPKVDSNPVLFEYPPDQTKPKTDGNVIIFTRHDHKQLQSPHFLNDTIISFFMQFHLDNNVEHKVKEKIHIFNSFFFAKINSIRQNGEDSNSSFAHASRWIKSVNIFDKDFLIMPVCEKDHWILIIVCYPSQDPKNETHKIPDDELCEPAVLVLNSCHGMAPKIKRSLSMFLKFQWFRERRTEKTFTINSSKRSCIKLFFPELPQQKNNYDCGVYILGYFYSFLRDPRKAYVKMFRKQSLKSWLIDNDIDISRERRKMKTVIERQISSWRLTEGCKKKNGIDSQEIHIDSPMSNSSIDLVEEEAGPNGHVIVIN